MSIDYDRLEVLVEEMEQGVAATTRYTWLDLAHELLHLRDELTDLRDTMHTQAEHLRRYGHRMSAEHAENHARSLTRIMQGDTE